MMEEQQLDEHQESPVEDDDFISKSPPIRPKTVAESFRYAVDGILDVFRTQKHMRFHFVTMLIVLLAVLLFDVAKRDILIIIFVISLVLVAEMFNTAIEAVVDLVTQTYHPMAKFAKDAAAGAVLIATTTAILVALMLAIGDTGMGAVGAMRPEDPGALMRVLLTGAVLLVAVTILKVLSSKGKLLRGGIVSGHVALGFFLALSILFFTRNPIAFILGIMLALLIAQSRVESKVHTIQEVVSGALLAILITAMVYWFPNLWEVLSQYLPIDLEVF